MVVEHDSFMKTNEHLFILVWVLNISQFEWNFMDKYVCIINWWLLACIEKILQLSLIFFSSCSELVDSNETHVKVKIQRSF